QAQWKAAVKLLEETRKFGNVNATNWVGLEDTLNQLLESDYASDIAGAVARARVNLQNVIAVASSRAIHLPHFKGYIKHIINKAVPSGDQEAIDLLYRHFFENSVSVKSRGFAYGSVSAGGGNIGNNTILRVTKDENNFDLEAATAEAKEAKCIQDRNTGSGLDAEVFRFRGSSPGRDALQFQGSGGTRDIQVYNHQSSLLRNPSFEDFSGAAIATPSEISSWVSSVAVSGTTYELDETNVYRPQQSVTTPRSLKIKTTSNLTQKLSTFNTKLNSLTPYFLQIAWNRSVGSADGTLVIRLGAQSASVVVAAQSGWQILRCPTTFGQNNWYKNFDEDDLDISIEWTRTSGNLLIDDVLLVPMQLFDGTWYAITANNGTHIASRKDDIYTWSDTIASDSILQYWLYRTFGRYLPHSGSPSIADP
ncbi:MAG TPA: hypothetical protein VJU16_05140, partial [Planctomycetota bacterium]|nr:hypothetical protein [Planctomycetota bacterium]